MATTGKTGGAPVKKRAQPAAEKAAAKPATKPATKSATKPATKPASGKAKPAAAKPAGEAAKTAKAGAAPVALAPEQRRYYVEVAAYYIAERRGFHGDRETDDWAQAEAEVDNLVRAGVLKP